jgi:hypothetical protein
MGSSLVYLIIICGAIILFVGLSRKREEGRYVDAVLLLNHIDEFVKREVDEVLNYPALERPFTTSPSFLVEARENAAARFKGDSHMQSLFNGYLNEIEGVINTYLRTKNNDVLTLIADATNVMQKQLMIEKE